MGRLCLAALIGVALLTACSEEDRRAWVSILPLPGDEPDTTAARRLAGEIAITPDSTAVLIGSDTLFTRARVPGSGPNGEPLSALPIVAIVPSPDSTAIAFVSGADRSVVGVWSRRRQLAGVAEVYAGGDADGLKWSPDGRYLAYSGKGAEGAARAGLFDVREFRSKSHPILAWLAREGRSAWPQDWIHAGRLRLLVAPGREMEGGLAYSWEIAGGSLMLESHVEPLAERAPPGTRLEPGGVFSLDLLGDPAPETVALFRASGGIPGALVMESRGAEFRVTPSVPLVPAAALGLEDWESAGRGAALYQLATLGGAACLLLDLPSNSNLRAIGIFRAGPGGALEPLAVIADGEGRPAIFFDGIFGDVTSQLGLVDLDGDGSLEVVSAVGRASATLEPGIEWTVAPYRARADGSLVPAPELRESALETVRRATGR
ncbi:MAG TPA: hypothetical protein VFH11_08415 [Gemmatimonadota bacterium]|nr:hypothetical protein [Gemmatimonadota bacterium]